MALPFKREIMSGEALSVLWSPPPLLPVGQKHLLRCAAEAQRFTFGGKDLRARASDGAHGQVPTK
ncbi:hypothetical protein Nm8I071_23340 [Nonomuraea sp. TT08I-71]|nr:hypothetical protein Nm8I071_23340 [Nonomuraea sp. TT08I-71]